MPQPPVTPAAPAAKENATPAFDADKFRNDTVAAVRAENQQLQSTILSQVQGMMDAVKTALPKSQPTAEPAAGDFTEEAKALGLDEDQTKAIVSMMNKQLGKRAPDVTEDVTEKVMTKIGANSKWEQQKQELNRVALTEYPDAGDKNSPLFKQAQLEYERIKQEDPAMANSPRLASMAVIEAARHLGIKPLTLADIRANEARNENGSGGSGGPKGDGEVSKKQTDFASNFNVSADLFKEKRRLVELRSVKRVG